MMLYLQKSKRPQNKTLLTVFILTAIIIAILLLIQIFAGGIVTRVALTVGAPFASTFTGLKNGLGFGGGFLTSKASLIKENQDLRSHIVASEADLFRLRVVEREYERLLESYGRNSSTTDEKLVLGNVIAKPPQSPYDVLVIDIGRKIGVGLGDRVYGPGNVLVGRVSEATDSTAKVVMYSSVGEKNDMIVERTSESVSVEGAGGGNLEAEVPQEMDIVVGDTIVLPQFNGAVVASVVSIDASVTSAFKRVLFKTPLNIFSFRWVNVTQ